MSIRIKTLFPFSVRIKRILKKLGRILKIFFFLRCNYRKSQGNRKQSPFLRTSTENNMEKSFLGGSHTAFIQITG